MKVRKANMELPSGSGSATRSCPHGASQVLPYLPSACTPSDDAALLSSISARPVVEMNRSWSWQMQSHRNYLRLSDTVYSADRSFQHPSSNTTTMDPTTLVTFLFKAPPEARTVELLGSWDNFAHPYLMEHDRRRGSGFWSGCFKFEQIIFDGDSSDWNKPRNGGLKQGGTYWYYYRLNDEAEVYDDSKQHTTTCPLLPGQPVNVMEVPLELPQEIPPRARSVSMDIAATIAGLPSTQTLDPRDKFNPLEPPPVSKVHGRCLSDFALNGRLETKAQALRSMESIPSPPESPVHENPVTRSSIGDAAQPRYYTENGIGRTSFTSQRSWHSSTPSYAQSSNYDDYDYDHTNAFDLTPVPEVPSSRPATNSSSHHNHHFDFGFQQNSSGSWIEDVEPWVSQPESYSSATWPLTSADDQTIWPPRDTTYEPQQWDPYHGWSTHELQDNGHFSDVWTLPETVSLPELCSLSPRPHTSHGDLRTAPLRQWPLHELEQAHNFEDEWQLHEEADEDFEDRRPRAESDTFDVLSPSFSAATISSVGLGTPFRLSVGPSNTTSSYGHQQEPSIHEVAEKLRSLSAEDLDRRNQVYESEERALSTYTLPRPDETSEPVAPGHVKVPTPQPSIAHNLTLPTMSGSLEDDIFSALSF